MSLYAYTVLTYSLGKELELMNLAVKGSVMCKLGGIYISQFAKHLTKSFNLQFWNSLLNGLFPIEDIYII